MSQVNQIASQFRSGSQRIVGIVDACRFELATVFEIPSRDLLSFHGSKIGLSSNEMGELLRELCD